MKRKGQSVLPRPFAPLRSPLPPLVGAPCACRSLLPHDVGLGFGFAPFPRTSCL